MVQRNNHHLSFETSDLLLQVGAWAFQQFQYHLQWWHSISMACITQGLGSSRLLRSYQMAHLLLYQSNNRCTIVLYLVKRNYYIFRVRSSTNKIWFPHPHPPFHEYSHLRVQIQEYWLLGKCSMLSGFSLILQIEARKLFFFPDFEFPLEVPTMRVRHLCLYCCRFILQVWCFAFTMFQFIA